MIISINPTIFESTDVDILAGLSKILKLAATERHLVDIGSFYECVFDSDNNYILNETTVSIDYLSPYDNNQIERFFDELILKSAYLTEMHKKYLTNITIGLDSKEFNPLRAYDILNEPSKIIVENAKNDWKFIKGIAEKYANHRKRKAIYQIVEKAINNLWIEAENAGGKGQIKIRFEDLSANRYKGIYKFKLATIFDSDKDHDNVIKNEQLRIIEFFKGKSILPSQKPIFDETDVIVWHMLYKREAENYVPVNIILQNMELTDIQKVELINKAKIPEDYDFLDFDDYFKHPRTIDVKNDFPELFLKTWTRDNLEQRCEHHKITIELPNSTLEEVTEIEEILLKIAKII